MEMQSYVQDPNFPASPRQAELCSARKHLVYLKGNNWKHSGHKHHRTFKSSFTAKNFILHSSNKWIQCTCHTGYRSTTWTYLFATTVSENKTS